MDSSKSSTDNDKWQIERKPSFTEVDKLATELSLEYNNPRFYRWYCLVINILGPERVRTIRAMYGDIEDVKSKAKLFSIRASQEAKQKVGIADYQKLKSKYGKK